jgi:hypothetical protein
MVLKRFAEQIQFDSSLAYAMAARMWQAFSGPITIIFLIRALTLPEQGIYYTLVSILGIQMFFELGLLNILVSHTGHQVAALSSPSGRQRMTELVRASQRWFGGASILFAIAAIAFGWNTLSQTTAIIQWQLPLIALVLASAGTIALSPSLAVLEGAGYREDVYRVRLLQMLSGNLIVWLTLTLGLKLWALPASAAVQLAWSAYLAWGVHRNFFAQFREPLHAPSPTARDVAEQVCLQPSKSGDSGFSWTRDVLPTQWRLAVISVVYHFATQFFTVIVWRYHSPIEAGRLGMTLSITGAIQAMALAWIHTKFSLASAHHGAGNREAAGNMWRRTALASTGLLILAMGVAITLVALMPLAQLGIETRFIAPWQMATLALGCLANHLIAIEGFYVLSRRSKPFLVAALFGFSSTAVAVWWAGYYYSTTGIVLGYTLTTVFITLPAHTYAYLKFRRIKDVG